MAYIEIRDPKWLKEDEVYFRRHNNDVSNSDIEYIQYHYKEMTPSEDDWEETDYFSVGDDDKNYKLEYEADYWEPTYKYKYVVVGYDGDGVTASEVERTDELWFQLPGADTLDASDVEAAEAKLRGDFYMPRVGDSEGVGSGDEIGGTFYQFQYWEKSDPEGTEKYTFAHPIESNQTKSHTISDLKKDTTYEFIAILLDGNLDEDDGQIIAIGDNVKEFTTTNEVGDKGYVWVDGENFHYINTDGEEAYVSIDSKTDKNAKPGYFWIEGEDFCWTNENGEKVIAESSKVESVDGVPGYVWIDGLYFYYISESGDKRQCSFGYV